MQHLQHRAQFQAVIAGVVLSRTAHFVLHGLDLSQLPAATPDVPILFPLYQVWMGAMVPKRWAKRAVTRNTIKRQIYALSQDFQSCFPIAAHVVRLRAGFDRKQFVSATSDAFKAAVRAELQMLFLRANSHSAQVVGR